MTIYIDIDNTICHTPKVEDTDADPAMKAALINDYTNSKPIKENIAKANKLYDKGHKIIYWTARGASTGIDWSSLTDRQLTEWGAKRHELKMGKPDFDLLIDDKVMNTEDWLD